MRILLLFLDGVGLGASDSGTNPFLNASLPVLDDLLAGHSITLASAPHHTARASLVPVDAVLGIGGTPQSGTGQAALLTGVNAVAMHGRHFGPWVPARLRQLVRDENLLTRAVQAGHDVAFANAYPEEVLQQVEETGAVAVPSDAPDRARAAGGTRRRRTPAFLRAGPPLAALGAGLLTRHTRELEAGDAVASEITNEGWRERLGRTGVPVIDARRAGRNLAAIVARHELTMFAHYATDYAGHRRDMDVAVHALERVDAFIGGLLEDTSDDTLVLVVGDHGNIEDVTTGHTRNPALGLVIGNGHELLARRIRSLCDLTPALLDLLALET